MSPAFPAPIARRINAPGLHPPGASAIIRAAGFVASPTCSPVLHPCPVNPPGEGTSRVRRDGACPATCSPTAPATTAGQLVRLALGDHRRAPARPIDPPGSNGAVGAVPGGDSRGLLGPAPGHRNSIPARTIPGPGHGVPLPKVDRQGVRPVLRAPSYDRYTPPSSAAVPPPPTASRPPPTPSPCAPTSDPSPDANN